MERSRYACMFALISFCLLSLPPSGACAEEIQVKVTVEGLEGELLNNVLLWLGIEKQKDDPRLTVTVVRRLHNMASEEIRKALEPFGYYNPIIRSELLKKDSIWNARYGIETGPPALIRDIDFKITGEGADDDAFTGLMGELPFQPGDVFIHETYEKTKRMFRDTASERGYFDALFTTRRASVDRDQNTVDITMQFDTGIRYRFGEVILIQDAYRDEFVSGFIKIQEGDYFSHSALLRLENILFGSGYFSSVRVMPRRDLAEVDRIPVEVFLIPKKRHRYAFGIGYGTDTGARGNAGWENRRVNRRGHRIGVDLRLSQISSDATAKYRIPLEDPAVNYLDFTAGWKTEDTETSETEIHKAGISRTGMRFRWQETAYINYQQEEFTVADEEGRSNLLVPGISWALLQADDPVNTSRGGRLFLDVKGAHEYVLSDTSFLQFHLQTKYIVSTGRAGRFIFRGEAGTSLVDQFTDLPPSHRFFTGGDRSIRGYTYNSLGPENDDGEVFGGRHLIVGSIEYELKIIDQWSVAFFYDAGNAINAASDRLEQGAGFGIRWISPIGPVRVDLASAISRPDHPWRFHLTIGPDL